MTIKFKEQKAIEIIQFNKSIEYDISYVNSIYIKHISFVLVKMYYLNIITKDRKKIHFFFLERTKKILKEKCSTLEIL